MSNPDIIKQLSAKIRQLQRPQSKPDSEFHETLTDIEAFDALLPSGGLSGGTLIEWLSPQGGGGSTLATILAARLLERGNAAGTSILVVIDTNREFYPPAMTGIGISLDQIVMIRPNHIGEAIWAFEQSLRCSGITISMAWIEHLTDQTYRRLQLATEAGGGVGFLIRTERYQRQRSWADARFLVTPTQLSSQSPAPNTTRKPPLSRKPITRSSPPPNAVERVRGNTESQQLRTPHSLSTKSGPLTPALSPEEDPPSSSTTISGGEGACERAGVIPGASAHSLTSATNLGAQFRRLNVQLLHCRGRIDGGEVQLEINNETGDVHLASRLASSETQPRKARA